MLEAKVAGHEIAKPEPAPETPVIDLMEALKASVAETKKPAKKAAAAGPKRRRAPAKAKSA
jgi:non-homologous end joining protein Ku